MSSREVVKEFVTKGQRVDKIELERLYRWKWARRYRSDYAPRHVQY